MRKFIIVAGCALALGACASQRQTEGTAVGAVAGAVVAGPIGAVVGGTAGALVTAPGAIGSRRCYVRRHGRVYRRWC